MKDYSFSGDNLRAKPAEGKKFDIPFSEVDKVHGIDEEATYLCWKDKGKLQLLEEGALQLIDESITTTSRYSGGTTHYYYVVSPDTMLMAYSFPGVIGLGKDKIVSRLRRFVSDNPELLARLGSEEFKLNQESVLRLVRDYNLSKWQSQATLGPTGVVFFYLKARRGGPTSAKLLVNEKDTVTISTTRPALANLEASKPSKICLGSYCQPITANLFYVKYFEVSLDGDAVSIEQVLSKKAKKEIQYRFEKESKR